MHRPIHFELQVVDPGRSTPFFETVFGWKFSRWEGPQEYRIISTGAKETPGIDGGFIAAPDLRHPGPDFPIALPRESE